MVWMIVTTVAILMNAIFDPTLEGPQVAWWMWGILGLGIAMVTLDMVMPGMGGLETFTHLKEIDPDVKVLIISGYSPNQEVRELLRNGCCGFLQKPFNIRHFSQKLKEVLAPDRPGDGALRVAGE